MISGGEARNGDLLVAHAYEKGQDNFSCSVSDYEMILAYCL